MISTTSRVTRVRLHPPSESLKSLQNKGGAHNKNNGFGTSASRYWHGGILVHGEHGDRDNNEGENDRCTRNGRSGVASAPRFASHVGRETNEGENDRRTLKGHKGVRKLFEASELSGWGGESTVPMVITEEYGRGQRFFRQHTKIISFYRCAARHVNLNSMIDPDDEIVLTTEYDRTHELEGIPT